jgi:hypothetical protein
MKVASNSDTETTADYEVGYGKPPWRAGFQKGRSGNPKGRPKGSKNFATLVSEALDEKVSLTEDGRRRRITKRELVIKQLVNKSASADLRAIKQLTDIVQGVEGRAGASQAHPQPPAFTAADEEVIAELRKRMERDIRAKIAAEETSLIVTLANAGAQGSECPAVAPRSSLGRALDSRVRGNDE